MISSFKPYYKWNTFNTQVLLYITIKEMFLSFKPCYKWNTFNTANDIYLEYEMKEF